MVFFLFNNPVGLLAMIIYGIAIDIANIKTFVLEEDNSVLLEGKSNVDVLGTFIGRGDRKAGNWNPPTVKWFDDDGRNIEKYKDPDISYFGVASSLLLNPHATELVRNSVSDIAELLPVSFNDEIWSSLNVFNVINALDKEKSRYKIRNNGRIGRLLKVAFLSNEIPHGQLFKIPEKASIIYFAEHHPDDSENNFKNIVEKNKLFGIKFVKVWEN